MEQVEFSTGGREVSTEAAVSRIGFTPVANDILYDASLSAEARFAYTIIRSHMYGDKADCYPGMERLSKIIGKSEKTIRGNLDELVAAGLIRKKRRGPSYEHGRTNLYTLTDAALKRERGVVQTLNLESRPVNITDQDRANVTDLDRPKFTDEEDKAEEDKVELTYSGTETSSVAATDISGKESGETAEDSVVSEDQVRSAREFVAGVYAQTTPSGRSTLDEVVKETPKRTYTNADTFGSQYKQLIAAEDLTPEEYEAVVAIVADDLCSPQKALKVIRDEGKPSTDDVSSSPVTEERFEGSTPRPLTTGDHKAIQRVLDDPESDSGKAGRAFISKSGGVESMVEVIEAVNRDAFDGKRTVPEIGRAVEDALDNLAIMEVFPVT